MANGGLQQTQSNLAYPRADFNKEEFDILIEQKGRDVIVETALRCPCKSSKTNQQSDCRNCGGTGYIFINPRQTRIVTQSMDVMNTFKPWSEEARGTMRVSCKNIEELSFMDRITALDGVAIFTEVLHMKKKGATLFAYTTYAVKQMRYVGVFIDSNTVLQRLVQGTDYTIEGNVFKLAASFVQPGVQDISVTLRYTHAPTYHMIELTRETMESFEYRGAERLIRMPQAGLARRTHYLDGMSGQNLAGDRLLDNSFDTSCVTSLDCGCP